ncbi:MAG TPA: OmpH family outer membrane protein [Cyclobacteriaceae bacterium]|jgi:outer membrane protein|nr:OmpH family outer membrane protein [Cyclobacteriaceae bacterium]
MKNLSLILNAVLIVAVGVLYYLHFSGGPRSTPSGTTAVPGDTKIAYINSDSVLKNYEYFKVTREKLESKGKKLDADLRNRAQGLQNDYEAYQRNVSNLTIGQAKSLEEDLQKKQQNLQLYQQSLTQEMSGEEQKITQDLYTRVTDFLKKYGNEKGLQIVLKFDTSSDLLFGGENLDITKDVTAGLNEAYQVEKKSPASKTDSTATKKK